MFKPRFSLIETVWSLWIETNAIDFHFTMLKICRGYQTILFIRLEPRNMLEEQPANAIKCHHMLLFSSAVKS